MTSCVKLSGEANNMSTSSSKNRGAAPAAKLKGKSDNPKSKELSVFDMNSAVSKLQFRHFNREKGYRLGVCEDIATACDLGLKLEKNAELWKAFCNRFPNSIGKPKETEQDDAVRWVLKYMVGPGRMRKKGQASTFAPLDLWSKKVFRGTT